MCISDSARVCLNPIYIFFMIPFTILSTFSELLHRSITTVTFRHAMLRGPPRASWAGDTWLKRSLSMRSCPWRYTGRNHPLGAWRYRTRKSCKCLVWSDPQEDVMYWPLPHKETRQSAQHLRQCYHPTTVCFIAWRLAHEDCFSSDMGGHLDRLLMCSE